MLHIASFHGHSNILIWTVDTDVVAIVVRISQLLEALQQLWITFGIGKSLRYLAIHETAAAMGPQKALHFLSSMPLLVATQFLHSQVMERGQHGSIELICWANGSTVKLIFHATFYSERDYEDHRKVCHFNV